MYGVDLAVWWRSRRWVGLLELIDELPAASRLNEAIQDDPEYARQIAELGESDEKWSPRVRDYDLTATLLREIREALVAVRNAVLATGGQRPNHVPAFPVPVTEVDRQKVLLIKEWAVSTLGRFGFDETDI